MNNVVLATFIFVGAGVLPASTIDERQATITGGGGSGKCTIEVVVDGVADVEVQGSVARLHTIQGQTATWRRFQCNQPMPPNPANFRFQGIDGRGHQSLIGDPRRNGVAVVRIEDPKSGSEGYTFDLMWGGGDGGYQNGPPANGQPGYGQPGYGRPGDGQAGYGRGDRDNGPGSIRRDPEPGPPPGGPSRFGPDAAVRNCSDAAADRVRQDGYRDVRIQKAEVEDKPGHNDWIYGNLVAQRGPRMDSFNFGCSVDFDSGRIRSVNVNPRGGDGYYGRDDAGSGSFTRDQAVKACSDAVRDRIRNDGYRDIRISGIDNDRRQGQNGWLAGGMTGRRGDDVDNFDFSCSVDFDSGRVRSINVNRR